MIDVDGRVVSGPELARRIEHLVGPVNLDPATTDGPRAWHTATTQLPTAHIIPVLSGTVQRIHRPHPPAEHGLNARLRWSVKRALHKLLGWQTEPRWAAQRELDEQLIHYAAVADDTLGTLAGSSDHIRDELAYLHAQIRRLDQANTALQRQLEAILDPTTDSASATEPEDVR